LEKKEVVRLLGLLREKEKFISGLIFLNLEDIKSSVWRSCGTLARNRAPLS